MIRPLPLFLAIFFLYLLSEESKMIPHEKIVREEAVVKRVIDGDTIELENGEKVRLIGIDAPESHSVSKKEKIPECFAKEATDRNRSLTEGKTVTLAKDVSEKDAFGRLLRYVYVDDFLLNEALVREGYALAIDYAPNVSKSIVLRAAENEAKANGRGLWKTCGNRKE